MGVPSLLHNVESWTLQKANVNKITATEIRFLKMATGT